MSEHLSSNEKVDQEGLRLFAEWLGMNYGKKVFGDHMEHHALRIFSHATSVIRSRASAHEPCALRDSQPQIIRGVVEQFGQYIVHGTPGHYGWLPEDHELQHNCDAMACGQDHALARFPIERATPLPAADALSLLRAIYHEIETYGGESEETMQAIELLLQSSPTKRNAP
jgi:hypothetical protein